MLELVEYIFCIPLYLFCGFMCIDLFYKWRFEWRSGQLTAGTKSVLIFLWLPLVFIDLLLFTLVTIPKIPRTTKIAIIKIIKMFKDTYFNSPKQLAQNYVDQLKCDGYSEEEIKEVIIEMNRIE